MESVISRKKMLTMVLMGSVLEAYDYSLYGYFAPLLAHLFFPDRDSNLSLLLTLTVFAVGFIMRPLGAAIFGYCGDKWGRKNVLIVSIMLMAIPTMLIGLLPTYAQIGSAAGLLLAFCRLLQGFAIGAEFVGTMIYMIEQAPDEKRTFYGSLSICSGYLASLFTALMVTTIIYFLDEHSLQTWGWRIPFIFGMILGLIGLYVRSSLPETVAFQRVQKKNRTVTNPLLRMIQTMPFTLLKGIGIVVLHVLGFYLVFVYMSSYMTIHYKIPAATTSYINTWILIVAVILLPIIGWFAEKVNQKYFIAVSAIGFILFSYPIFKLMQHGTFISMLIAQGMLTFLLCLISAVLPAFLSNLFPVSLRYTGMALCYNIAAVMFGGTAPLVLTFMVNKTNVLAPGFYLMFGAAITLVSLLLIIKNSSEKNNEPELAYLIAIK